MKQSFEKNIISIYGDSGKRWIDSLPDIISKISEAYHLTNLKLLKNLSYNYVLSGIQNSPLNLKSHSPCPNPIILKLGLDEEGFRREAKALAHFKELGAVHLLVEIDVSLYSTSIGGRGLLLERVIPGLTLKNYCSDNQTDNLLIACNVMRKLHHPNNLLFLETRGNGNTFPHIKDWLAILDRNWEIPHDFLMKARKLRERLLKQLEPETLLHGDLHRDNILQKDNDWVEPSAKGFGF